MFELHKDAIFLGHDAEGMAVFGLEKNSNKLMKQNVTRKIDMAKVAQVRADADMIAKLLGD